MNDARSQTITDIWITTLIEKDHLSQGHLVGPMPRQWTALHPNIVIENVRGAASGNQLENALAIEWFGVNWWDKDTSPVGFPFGISLTSLYSDRANSDNVGHGIMFHINNKFSFGWASHGGDDGYYITLDLLKLVGDNKKKWKKYIASIKKFGDLDN